MPILVASIVGALLQICASLVGRVLLALGIGFVAYQGIDVALDSLKTLVTTQLDLLPSGIVSLLAVLKVDVAISMVFSAMVARLAILGLTSGVVKRMVVK